MSLGQHDLEPAAPLPGASWTFCGLPVASPIGIAAGPLLNGGWVLHYADQGFDILTYKTVRSRSRSCFQQPNLVPISESQVVPESKAHASELMQGSWGISFGMPSRSPNFWRADIETIKPKLGKGRLLVVSVVASPESHWTIDDVADDYAQCAFWASESGADVVELNLSCPNVSSVDGQLYLQPELVHKVLERVSDRCPGHPLVIKIGHIHSVSAISCLIQHCATLGAAISMTNCLACTIEDKHGEKLWNGESRGIGGTAIRRESIAQVQRFALQARGLKSPPELIGIGGVGSWHEVSAYLGAGATIVQLATAAMLQENLGHQMKRQARESMS